ncbi:hypothetical protein TNCV_1420441 [Trichonephila clavipes]|nr:hypothetical protein TNCV_1420441 [Trichonephila clavipes]
MFPIHEKEHLYMFLIPNCILKDFTRTNLLDCPVGTKVYIHGVIAGKEHCTVSPFIRANDGFLFDVGNSCQESIRLVWNYAYPNKSCNLERNLYHNCQLKGSTIQMNPVLVHQTAPSARFCTSF